MKTLMLHRVLPRRVDNYYFRRGTAISFDHFRRLLDALEKHHRQTVTPLCPNDERATVDRRVCITFDDGYADNAAAFDELLARDLCATLFVVKDFIVGNFSPIDDMAAWLDDAPDAPVALTASLETGRLKKMLRSMSAQRYRRLRARHFTACDHKNAARFLTERQLTDYHRRGIAIGIHGRTHRVWSRMPSAQLRAEIFDTARWLRRLGIDQIAGLCFPHGQYRYCKNLGGDIARLAAAGLFGVDKKYADPAVTPRVWVKQDTDVERLFADD